MDTLNEVETRAIQIRMKWGFQSSKGFFKSKGLLNENSHYVA